MLLLDMMNCIEFVLTYEMQLSFTLYSSYEIVTLVRGQHEISEKYFLVSLLCVEKKKNLKQIWKFLMK